MATVYLYIPFKDDEKSAELIETAKRWENIHNNKQEIKAKGSKRLVFSKASSEPSQIKGDQVFQRGQVVDSPKSEPPSKKSR